MSKSQKQTGLEEFMHRTGLNEELEKLSHLKDKQDAIQGAKNMLGWNEGNVDKAVENWNSALKQIKNTPHPLK